MIYCTVCVPPTTHEGFGELSSHLGQRHSSKVSECCGAEWIEELGLHCPKCGHGTGFILMARGLDRGDHR
jgi:hypothetical protein